MARDFFSYYDEALAKRGLPPRSGMGRGPGDYLHYYGEQPGGAGIGGALPGIPAMPATNRGVNAAGATKFGEAANEGLPPLQWFVDLIMRPLYAVTQAETNIVDEQVQRLKNIEAGANPLGEYLAGTANIMGKTFGFDKDSVHNAFWGNEEERKRVHAQVIEESTDKYGEAFDPNYIDRVDNVNTVLKGATGLIADIGLDPTTYIPGAVIAKPLALAGKGIKKVATPLAYTAEGRARKAWLLTPDRTPNTTPPGGTAPVVGGVTPPPGGGGGAPVPAGGGTIPQPGATVPTGGARTNRRVSVPGSAAGQPVPAGGLTAQLSDIARRREEEGLGVSPELQRGIGVAQADDAARAAAKKPKATPGSQAAVARTSAIVDETAAKAAVANAAPLEVSVAAKTAEQAPKAPVIPEIAAGYAEAKAVDHLEASQARAAQLQAPKRDGKGAPAPKVEGAPAAPKMSRAEQVVALANGGPRAAAKTLEIYGALLKNRAVGASRDAKPFNSSELQRLLQQQATGKMTEAQRSRLRDYHREAVKAAEQIDATVVAPRGKSVAREVGGLSERDYLAALKGPRESVMGGALPPGALDDLEDALADMSKGDLPDYKAQAEKLLDWSGAGIDKKEVATLAALLRKEYNDLVRPIHTEDMTEAQLEALADRAARLGKPLDEVAKAHNKTVVPRSLTDDDLLQLAAIKEQAAYGRAALAGKTDAAQAVAAAAETKEDFIIGAGKLVLHTELFELMQSAPFVKVMRDFLNELERATEMVAKGFEEEALYGTRGFDPSGRGQITLTGIFREENADLLEDAVNHWLSAGGPLERELGRKPKTWHIGDQEVTLSVKDIRAVLARVTDPDGAPSSLDNLILKSVYERFYDGVQAGKHTHSTLKAVRVSNAFEALKWMTQHQYQNLENHFGVETARILRQNFDDNPTAFNNHFKTLSEVLSPAFGVDELYDVLMRGADEGVMVPRGESNVHSLAPFFEDIGLGGRYRLYTKHRAMRSGKPGSADNPSPFRITQADQEAVWTPEFIAAQESRWNDAQLADVRRAQEAQAARQAVDNPVETAPRVDTSAPLNEERINARAAEMAEPPAPNLAEMILTDPRAEAVRQAHLAESRRVTAEAEKKLAAANRKGEKVDAGVTPAAVDELPPQAPVEQVLKAPLPPGVLRTPKPRQGDRPYDPEAAAQAGVAPRPKPEPRPQQEPTPESAIPPNLPPEIVEEVLEQPTAIVPHAVDREQFLANLRALEAEAAADTSELGAFRVKVFQILSEIFKKNILDPEQLAITRGEFHVTDEIITADSKAFNTKVWGIQDQYEVVRKVYGLLVGGEGTFFINRAARERGVKPAASKVDKLSAAAIKASAEEPLFMELFKQMDWFAAQTGWRQNLGLTAADAIPLSLGNIVEGLLNNAVKTFGEAEAKTLSRLLLFMPQRAIMTNLGEAIRIRLTGGGRAEVMAHLLNNRKIGTHGGLEFEAGTVNNKWVDDVQITSRQGAPKPETIEEIKAVWPNARIKVEEKTSTVINKKTGLEEEVTRSSYTVSVSGEDVAAKMADWIEDSIEDIGATAVKNGWHLKPAITEGADLIGNTMREEMRILLENPELMPAYIRYLDDIENTAEGEARREGLYMDAAKVAVEQVTAEIPDIVKGAKKDKKVTDAGKKRKKKDGTETTPREQVADKKKATEQEQKETAQRAYDEEQAKAAAAKAELLVNAEVREPLEHLRDTPVDDIPPDKGAEVVDALRADGETRDLSMPYQNEYWNWLGKSLWNLNRWFNAAAGMPTIFGKVHAGMGLGSSYIAKFSNDIADISKTYDQNTLKVAFDHLQRDTVPPAGAVADAHAALQSKLVLLWSTSEKTVLGHLLLNGDASVPHLNGMLKKYFAGYKDKDKIPQFVMDKAIADAKKNGTSIADEMAAQWKSWEIEDPADFLLRTFTAAISTAEHRAVVSLFNMHMEKWGYASDVPRPGWKRPVASKDSAFIHFIDQEKYYPDELLAELHNADIFVSTSRQIDGQVGEFVRKSYIPMLNAWKRGMTVNRPGHHVRTQVGDTGMTFTVRGIHESMPANIDAIRISLVAGKYQDVDFMQMLEALHETGHIKTVAPINTAMGGADHLLTTLRINGEDVPYTAGRGADAIHRNGLRPTYHMGEGLFEDEDMLGIVAKGAKWVSMETGPMAGYGKFMGGLSQARDHWTRAQHFMQILRQETSPKWYVHKQFKGKWKTLEELEALAAKEVKKYHPDASMLTSFEAKYMRPFIPFYSWMAKILPGFMESLIRNPGRVSMLPKASYNLAVATGLNPDSIYNPFPTDQMFPSYMTNKMFGPQFQMPGGAYVGINPGFAHVDLLNTFLGAKDPLSAVMGMTTPAFRFPYEYSAGSTTGGIKINDKSDYIDSQIPFINYLANITGTSPTGTVIGENLWDNDDSTQGLIDAQHQAQRGNKQGLVNEKGQWSPDSMQSLLNFITGLGAQTMSRQNQQNFAELEARNRAGG